MKEISLLELLARNAARFAAVSGVLAVVIWLTWVLLDFEHMQRVHPAPVGLLKQGLRMDSAHTIGNGC